MLNAILAALLVPLVPYLISPAGAEETEEVTNYTVTVVADDDGEVYATSGESDQLKVFCKAGELTGDAVVLSDASVAHPFTMHGPVTLSVVAGGSDAKGVIKKKVIRLGVPAIDKDRGWLGVQVSEVPEALAAQLEVGDHGVLISNVIKGGPAEKAGIERHDVVVEIDGEAVGSTVTQAVRQIAAHKPGEVVRLSVLRGGKKIDIDVELGERSVIGNQWKFDFAPLAEIKEEITTRGRIIGRGPGGKWFAKDLGDIADLEDLPSAIRQLAPRAGCRTMIFVDGESDKISISMNRDGESVTIEREGDGQITVTRTDEEGNETEIAYEDEEALEAGDEEAYKCFSGMHREHAFLDPEHMEHLEIKLEGLEDGLEALEGKLGIAFEIDLGDAKDTFEDAREAFSKAMEMMSVHLDDLDIKTELKDCLFGHGSPIHQLDNFVIKLGKPEHTFTVNEEGKIEVRIRKGDSELVQIFTDADDLAQRNPELFEKYDELMSIK